MAEGSYTKNIPFQSAIACWKVPSSGDFIITRTHWIHTETFLGLLMTEHRCTKTECGVMIPLYDNPFTQNKVHYPLLVPLFTNQLTSHWKGAILLKRIARSATLLQGSAHFKDWSSKDSEKDIIMIIRSGFCSLSRKLRWYFLSNWLRDQPRKKVVPWPFLYCKILV